MAKKKEIWIADDGMECATEELAVAHEKEVANLAEHERAFGKLWRKMHDTGTPGWAQFVVQAAAYVHEFGVSQFTAGYAKGHAKASDTGAAWESEWSTTMKHVFIAAGGTEMEWDNTEGTSERWELAKRQAKGANYSTNSETVKRYQETLKNQQLDLQFMRNAMYDALTVLGNSVAVKNTRQLCERLVARCLEVMEHPGHENLQEHLAWMSAEFSAQRDFLKFIRPLVPQLSEGVKFIACDANGELWAFKKRPVRRSSVWGLCETGMRESEMFCRGYPNASALWDKLLAEFNEQTGTWEIAEDIKC